MAQFTTNRRLLAALVAFGATLPAASAVAQIQSQPLPDPPRTLNPSGSSPGAPAPAVPAGVSGSAGGGSGEGGLGGEGGEADAVAEGVYHYEELGLIDDPNDEGIAPDEGIRGGPVPELHVVRSGDTLWDICGLYFNNSYEWPRVWSYNPSITNPHWIYPGDLVRLYPAGDGPQALVTPIDDPQPDDIARTAPTRVTDTSFGLRQLAFIEREEMDRSFTVVASERENELLSTRDVVYLGYPEGEPPEVGRTYAVYSPTKTVYHPNDVERVVGEYVKVYGQVEVLSVAKGKRARAVVRRTFEPIERGQRVGNVVQTFRDVETVPNRENAAGFVVDIIAGSLLIGTQQLVFLDIGSKDGVEVGNRLFVVRAGDAKPLERSIVESGRDDKAFPRYAIGELLVVETGESTSVAAVTMAVQEAEVGDRVLLRKAR